MNITKLLADLKQLGYEGQIQITIPIPAFDPVASDPVPVEPPKATAKTRMWALNRLLAAPGQANRTLFRKFLWSVGWIAGAEEPESWKLEHVPTSPAEIKLLVARVMKFEAESKHKKPVEEV